MMMLSILILQTLFMTIPNQTEKQIKWYEKSDMSLHSDLKK